MIENIYNILTIVCVGLAIMSFIFLNVGDQIKKFSEVKKIKCALVVLFTMDILMVICIILGIIIRESLLNIDTNKEVSLDAKLMKLPKEKRDYFMRSFSFMIDGMSGMQVVGR